MDVSRSINLLLSRKLFCLFNIFYFSHISILIFPFVFYIPISLRSLSLHHYITTSLFIYTSLSFYFLLFLHTYLIAVSCFASLYNHLFIYLSCIHSNEGRQSELGQFRNSSHYGKLSIYKTVITLYSFVKRLEL